MVRDRVEGWRVIERIDVVLVRPARPTALAVSRWLSPTGVDATVVSTRTIGRDADPFPVTVSMPAVARDAGLPVGRFVVDPQLHWADVDGRHLFVSPVLGLRVSVRSVAGTTGSTRPSRRPCLARIEPLANGACPSTALPERAASLGGTHPALWSRWPVPVGGASEATPAAAVRPARLATPPAGFLRVESAGHPEVRADRSESLPV